MIEIKGLSKTYNGNIRAVDDLQLTVEAGSIFGFLGPNGAGKSTTIRMITGLLSPDSGSVLINGKDTAKDPVSVKKITAYVPDEPVFYERMSGAAYLRFIAQVYEEGPEAWEEALKTAEEFGLKDRLDEAVSSYSHGMKQKLSITAALMHQPEVFILDEPMSGLDPKSAFILKERMRKLCREGKTVFFSTHVMEVAEKICDRVAIINRGRIAATGTLSEIRAGSKPGETLEEIFLELTDENNAAG